METLIIKKTDDKSLETAGKIIKNGGLVAFPTETVYGLGANALDEEAVKKIYTAKGRPSDNPLIVHLAKVSDVEMAAREIPENAKKLLDAFAPGPFTLILKKQPGISNTVTAGLDTVGVRIPASAVARKFIEASGVPIAAPSANLSGKPSPTRSEHVIEDLNGRVDAIICAENCEVGVESTIIDVTCDIPTILRPGGITLNDVIRICGAAKVDEHVLKDSKVSEQPKCPGMKYKHYAPDAEVTVIEGGKKNADAKLSELIKNAKKDGKKVGVLAQSGGFGEDVFISSGENNKEYAKILFDALREFDKSGTDAVFAQLCDDDDYSLALKNRLYKSAGYKIIFVGEN